MERRARRARRIPQAPYFYDVVPDARAAAAALLQWISFGDCMNGFN
jgi:hypothetical protein